MNDNLIKKNLHSVISLVDKLRDINLENYIKLPKIVAVGSQSSGKSSLIEQIVGLDFLPRGSGLVTRRPLQIRMTYLQDAKDAYAIFDEIPGKKFTDFNQVRANIDKVTDLVCGCKKQIKDVPIILKIFSVQCPDLTIIDLPGLTRIPLPGQQADILKVTTNIIRKYMEDPMSIILCVIPANQDITNDEVLFLARKIDPQGLRTIGCVTKIDIMDRGTDVKSLLMNKSDIKLNLGFVGIKNRSQADIESKMTVKQSLREEKVYFSQSPVYSSVPHNNLGTNSLVAMTTKVLSQSIIKFLPDLYEQISTRINALYKQIKNYGRPLPQSQEQAHSLLWQLSNIFINEFHKALSCHPLNLLKTNKIQHLANSINDALVSILNEQLSSKPLDYLTDSNIIFALTKFDGQNMPGFPSFDAFLHLLQPLIKDLSYPIMNTLNNITDFMIQIVDLILSDIAKDFSKFRQSISSCVSHIISDYKKKSENFIYCLLKAEQYIYTNHPHFNELLESQENKKVSQNFKQNQDSKQKKEGKQQSQNSKEESKKPKGRHSRPLIDVLRKRVYAYFKVVVNNLRQLIPKNIIFFMKQQFPKALQFKIFQLCNDNNGPVHDWFVLYDHQMQNRLRDEKEYKAILETQQFLKTHPGFSIIRRKKIEQNKAIREKQMKEYELKKQKQKQKQQQKNQNKKESQKIQNNKIVSNGVQQGKKLSPVRSELKPSIMPNDTDFKKKTNSTDTYTNLFGTSKQKKEEIVQKERPHENFQQNNTTKNQGLKKKYNKEVGKATDKAVEQLYKNQKIQQESKKIVTKGASNAAQKQLGLSKQSSQTVGKVAGSIFSNKNTQNFLKSQTKKLAKQQVQIQEK